MSIHISLQEYLRAGEEISESHVSASNICRKHGAFIVQGTLEVARYSSKTARITTDIAKKLTYGIIRTACPKVLI